MPDRIQLSRTRGWRMPENTVKVDRTTKWGNRFVVWRDSDTDGQWYVSDGCCHWPVDNKAAGIVRSVEMHATDLRERLAKEMFSPAFVLRELRGKNLACWCKPDAPCHADTLLQLANQPTT